MGFPIGLGDGVHGRPPVHIEIILWIYAHAGEWPGSTAFFADVAGRFVDDGIATKDESAEHGYRLTELGRARVAAICETPPPRMVYIGQDGKEVKPY